MFSLPLNNNKPHRQGQWLLLGRILSPHLTQHPLRLRKDLLTLSRNYCGKTSGWPVFPCHLLMVTHQEAKGHSSSQGWLPPKLPWKTALPGWHQRMVYSIQEEGMDRQRRRGLKSSWRWKTQWMVVLWSPTRHELGQNLTCYATPQATVKTTPAPKHWSCGLTRNWGGHCRRVWRAGQTYWATWPSRPLLVKKLSLQSVSISSTDKCHGRWFCLMHDCWLVMVCLFVCLFVLINLTQVRVI